MEIANQLDMHDVVFIDETGSKPGINRAYGRAPKDERVNDSMPCNRGKNITMVAGLTGGGMIAPSAMTGAMNTKSFLTWLSTKLLPELAQGTTLVMDNLRVHHAKPVIKLIESHNCTAFFLPPYSPDLNPIEMAWSKVKSRLRAARPKSVKSLQNHFHQAIRQISEEETKSYIRSCGFAI